MVLDFLHCLMNKVTKNCPDIILQRLVVLSISLSWTSSTKDCRKRLIHEGLVSPCSGHWNLSWKIPKIWGRSISGNEVPLELTKPTSVEASSASKELFWFWPFRPVGPGHIIKGKASKTRLGYSTVERFNQREKKKE